MANHILVVDDDPDICNLVKMTLERGGYTVSYAYHATEAWRLAQTRKPDLVVLDIGLPQIDGWEFAKRLRGDNRLQSVPIVFLTARSGFLDRSAAKIVIGAAAYITKPFKAGELRGTVDKLLKGAS